MKAFVTLFSLLLFAHLCYAQTGSGSPVDSSVIAKISDLNAKKIDTILSYHRMCTGHWPVILENDTCNSVEIEYLFWSEKGRFLMQRFDNCKKHSAIEIAASLLNLVKTEYAKIAKESIKIPEYTQIVKGKKTSYSVARDHTCIYVFRIYAGSKILKKEIDDFDLDSKYDNKHLNKNYHYNQSTLLNALKKLVVQQVSHYYPQN